MPRLLCPLAGASQPLLRYKAFLSPEQLGRISCDVRPQDAQLKAATRSRPFRPSTSDVLELLDGLLPQVCDCDLVVGVEER